MRRGRIAEAQVVVDGGRVLGQLVAARRKGENGKKGGTSRQVILPNN